MEEIISKYPSSYKDPSGFIFTSQDGTIYRQINNCYESEYIQLVKSGLYDRLVNSNLLISHEESSHDLSVAANSYKIIKPKPVEFISYPYEWCFSQLKDAALTTLEINRIALEHGMMLKDASSYNIQFIGAKPIFIDTLSFENYIPGQTWKGYKQFCEHFLAPLSLMAYLDQRFSKLLVSYLDGIPLDLASNSLPLRTWGKLSTLLHIHLHSMAQKWAGKKNKTKITNNSLFGIIDSLQSCIFALKTPHRKSSWTNYYDSNSISNTTLGSKQNIVDSLIKSLHGKIRTTWDIGGNTGLFSKISANASYTISIDSDHISTEKNYLDLRNSNLSILPIVADITNPSPSTGFCNNERLSLVGRGPADLVIMLAVMHHLVISNNLTLSMLADLCSKIAKKYLIIEFVPKSDVQVQSIMLNRTDIFSDYTEELFQKELSKYFKLKQIFSLDKSQRTIYYYEK